MHESKQNFQIDDVVILRLLNEAATGVFITNEFGRIVYANRQAKIFFGYEENDLFAKSSELLAIK